MTYLISRLRRLWRDDGGWLQAALLGAGMLGKVFGGQAKGAADGRMAQANLQAEQDRTLTSQYGIGQNAQMQAGNLDLSRKGFEESARGGRAKQALIGDLLSRLQDVNISIPGVQSASITGGLRPSALSEGGRAAGSLLNKQALLKMLEGDKFQGGEMLKAPGVQAIPQASKWEKIAGILGNVGSIAGGIGQAASAFGGGGSSVPGMPFASGMPSQLPGTQMNGLDVPDAPLAQILQQIQQFSDPYDRRGGRAGQ